MILNKNAKSQNITSKISDIICFSFSLQSQPLDYHFSFQTSDGFDRVSASLANPVAMYPHYVQLIKVGVNFTYNKDGPKNDTWKVDVKGEHLFFIQISISMRNFYKNYEELEI